MADIFRTIKNQNYTVMSNHHLQNPNLSLKAMGLMSKILSLPDNWRYSVKGLAAYCKDGYESVRTALIELESEGYLVRRQIRNERGHIVHTEYIFRESPEMEITEQEETIDQEVEREKPRINQGVEPESDFPIVDKPKSDFPIIDKPESDFPIVDEPESDFPIMDEPESGFPSLDNPSLENRHRQSTKETNNNIINTNKQNISSSSTSCKEKRSEVICQIKKQIGYGELCPKFGKELPDQVVEVMSDAYLSLSAKSVCINNREITTQDLCKKFSQLKKAHIENIFEGMLTGPPIRNINKYLLTALYQAGATYAINVQRSKQPMRTDKTNKFNNFHQREYDYKKLEAGLLGVQEGGK